MITLFRSLKVMLATFILLVCLFPIDGIAQSRKQVDQWLFVDLVKSPNNETIRQLDNYFSGTHSFDSEEDEAFYVFQKSYYDLNHHKNRRHVNEAFNRLRELNQTPIASYLHSILQFEDFARGRELIEDDSFSRIKQHLLSEQLKLDDKLPKLYKFIGLERMLLYQSDYYFYLLNLDELDQWGNETKELLNSGDSLLKDYLAAKFCIALGAAILEAGQAPPSLPYLNIAYNWHIKHNKKHIPNRTFMLCLHKMSNAYSDCSDYPSAVFYCKQAYNMTASDNSQSAKDHLLGVFSNNIADAYRMMSKEDSALVYFKRSVKHLSKQYGEDNTYLKIPYTGLGNVYLYKDATIDTAILYYSKVLDIAKRSPDDPCGLLDASERLSSAYFAKNDIQNAEKVLKEYSHLLDDAGSCFPETKLFYWNAAVKVACENRDMSELRKLRLALDAYAAELEPEDSEESGWYYLYEMDREFLATALKGMYDASGNVEYLYEARNELQGILNRLERYRASKVLNRSRELISQDYHHIYRMAMNLAYQLAKDTQESKYFTEALVYTDRNRANSLYEAAYQHSVDSFDDLDPETIKAYSDIQQKVGELNYRIKTTEEVVLLDSLKLLSKEQNQLDQRISDRLEEWKGSTFSNAEYLETIQDALDEESMVMYDVMDTLLYVFHIKKNDFSIQTVTWNQSMSEEITSFRAAIEKNDLDEIRDLGKALYNKLILPIEADLEDRVVFVPTSYMYALPFAALVNTKDEYLIENYEIELSHSALAFALKSNTTKKYDDRIALFSPISFETEHKIAATRNLQLNDLPFTKNEVESIQKAFEENKSWLAFLGSYETELFEYEDASEATFRDNKTLNSKYIHLATHAFSDGAMMDHSAVYLKASVPLGEELIDETVENYDGVISAAEIYNLDIAADLVTLSGCDTGRAKVLDGEGLMGLTHALMYAGANNVAVSLWKIDDQASALLMRSFYENMVKDGDDNYAAALRKAMIEKIHSSKFNGPKYWAAFVLYSINN